MQTNLATLPQDEMDKVNVDLAAAGVAFKERYNMPIVAEVVEREQPEHLRNWFRERLIAHRLASVNLSRLRQVVFELDFALVVVHHGNFHRAAQPPDMQADDPLFRVADAHHRFHRVIQRIAEQRVNVARAHE